MSGERDGANILRALCSHDDLVNQLARLSSATDHTDEALVAAPDAAALPVIASLSDDEPGDAA